MIEIEFHPVADIFPMMSQREFTELADDIRAHGLREPVWLHSDGRIIDGRNRYRACRAAGIDPQFRTYDGGDDDLVGFVVSLNLHRRHLNESQRGMVAARIATMRQGERTDLEPSENFPKVSQQQAAELLRVSDKTLRSAKKVQEQAVPELAKRVESGEVAVSTAALVSEAPEEEQREVIAADDEKAIIRKANEIKRRKREEREQAKEEERRAILAQPVDMDDSVDIRHGDFREILKDLDGTVDAVITDPPYPEQFLPLFDGLSEVADRILKVGGICAVMVGQSYLPQIVASLSKQLNYHWTLAYLTPGGQAVQLWQRKVNTFWKPVLLYVKGEYAGDWIGDVTKSSVNDNDKDHHHWGQSESGMADLIGRLTRPGQLICDPFLGGGTTAVVAHGMSRRFVGCDIDEQCLATTTARFGRRASA